MDIDNENFGKLIWTERKKMGLTQAQLAEKLLVSDKAVSKWERGKSMPDVAILPKIAELFNISLEKMMSGDLKENALQNGNLLKTKFYVCSICGNILTSAALGEISCCGRKLSPLEVQDADHEHRLNIETVEDEYYLTTTHPMSKEHYIAFVALIKGDTMVFKRTYPQWDLNVRLPKRGHGKLIYYCVNHGLYSIKI